MAADALTLPAPLVPRAGTLADVACVAAGAALIALAAQVSIPLGFTPVPVTGQTFGVLLVGASLGAVRGSASALLYVAVGALGAPVYADGAGGWSIVTGATGGYLVGFVLAAALVGALAERRWDRGPWRTAAIMLAGSAVIYAVGLPWLAAVVGSGFEQTLRLGLTPFLWGDLLKLLLAAGCLPAAWRLVARLRDPAARR